MRPRILIAVQDDPLRRDVRGTAARSGLDVLEAADPAAALELLGRRLADVVVTGSPPHAVRDGVRLAERIRERHRQVPVILVTTAGSEALAVEALRAGVSDYLRAPLSPGELAASVERCRSGTRTQPTAPPAARRLIGQSAVIRSARSYIQNVAAADSNVLITGETGTGKELAAELIHRQSPRGRQPFVAVNCAAIPDTLLESELFGYERGAFTGAHTSSDGTLQRAHGGTAFLDEIGDMSPHAQAKILRAIENREVHRLGAKRASALDIRVIAATNRDVDRLVREGGFRSDLYFRLNVARVHLPPLRQRPSDIPALLQHFLAELNQRFGLTVDGLTDAALQRLLAYEWPGNVRELRNVLEACFINRPAGRIDLGDLPEPVRGRAPGADAPGLAERERLLSALLATNWNKSRAARRLNWSRMTVYRKMAQHRVVRSAGPAGDGPAADR